MQYSAIQFNIYTIQALVQLKQGLDHLFGMYLHCVNELLSKVCHISDMSEISVEGLNQYTMVYGLNCIRLKDSVAKHWSVWGKKMEDCFKDICDIVAGYERAKGYCRGQSQSQETSTINRGQNHQRTWTVLQMERTKQNNCRNLKGNNSIKFQNKTPTWQNYEGNNYRHKFVTIRTTVICSKQESYHSKPPSKFGQVMMCQ